MKSSRGPCVSHTRSIELANLLGDDAVLLSQSVDAVIWLSHPPDGPADGVGLGGGEHPSGFLIDVSDDHLDGSVVLGGDDAVARRAESDKYNNETGEQF